MKRSVSAAITALWAGLFAFAACGQDAWVDAGTYSEMHIVIPENPSETLQYAAALFQKYWQNCTGREIEISPYNEGAVNVWLGPEVITSDLLDPAELEGLGESGCLIKTYAPPRRQKKMGAHKQLLISGATELGTLNGVFEFFQRFIGVKWMAPGAVQIARARWTLPEIDFRHEPVYDYRETGYSALWAAGDKEYRLAQKLPERYAPGPFGVETVAALFPRETYFAAHPEYFAEVNGKRVDAANGQLCFGNPATADAVLNAIKEIIAVDPAQADPAILARRSALCRDPEGKVWSISPMAGSAACQCPVCREIDAREGTPMGSLLTLVNRVAEGLENAFPGDGYQVHTLAWEGWRKPPETLRPRDNVLIQVHTGGCDFGRPLDDPHSPANAAFVAELKAWSNLTDRLYAWDCAANLACGQRPHPNFHVIQPNLRTFDQYGVKGVYEEGWDRPGSKFSEFDALRGYLLSATLWDPDCLFEDRMAGFIASYYGPAAKQISDYIALMTGQVQQDGAFLGCRGTAYWLNYDAVEKAEALFQEALAQKLTEDQQQRVAMAHLPVQYAALVCPPRIRVEADKLLLERPPSLSLDEYVAAMKNYGEGVEETDAYHPVQDIMAECGGQTPPRREESELIVLENEQHLVWIAPGLNGAVLRWRDKALGVELLRGYEHYGACPGMIQEWNPAANAPAAATYDVLEKRPDRVVLTATLLGGLTLTRAVALLPQTKRLAIELTLANPTAAPLAFPLVLRPEFYTQGEEAPELWANNQGAWKRIATGANSEEVSADAAVRWAFHIPGKALSLVTDYDPAQTAGAAYRIDPRPPYQQMNLELAMPDTPLGPGESRRLRVEYWAASVAPGTGL